MDNFVHNAANRTSEFLQYVLVKEMVILLHMHILQEYERNNSTMSVFIRIQGWGFAVCVLLLNQEEINLKG